MFAFSVTLRFPAVTSNPLLASRFPSTLTTSLKSAFALTMRLSVLSDPSVTSSLACKSPVTSTPLAASTFPAKDTCPPVVCVIAWLSMVSAAPEISTPLVASMFSAKVACCATSSVPSRSDALATCIPPVLVRITCPEPDTAKLPSSVTILVSSN